MFKLTKTILNNLNNKTYKKNKDSLELYDLSAINRVPLGKDSILMHRIDELEIDCRRTNLKIYMKNMAKLHAKQTVAIATPILLGSLTIASFVNGKFIKTINVDEVYHNITREFDEESIFSNEEKFYTDFFWDKNYVSENVENDSINTSSYAQFYYGYGNSSIQVKFDINADNTWQYSSHTTNLYDRSAYSSLEATEKLDEQYKELIKEATETFIRQADLSEEEIAYLREVVSNNENDIIVKIKKCERIENMDLDVYSIHWLRCAILIIADVVLAILAIKFWDDLKEVQRVEVHDNHLAEPYQLVFDNLFTAALEYRKAFLEVEENRINSINSILLSNGGSDKILSKYEKKLVHKNDKRLEEKDK